jgi:DNA-binding response OmpR family regulator
VLGQSGFRVIVATNGEDALALAKRENVCAVISDVAMPGPINGFELRDASRGIARAPE